MNKSTLSIALILSSFMSILYPQESKTVIAEYTTLYEIALSGGAKWVGFIDKETRLIVVLPRAENKKPSVFTIPDGIEPKPSGTQSISAPSEMILRSIALKRLAELIKDDGEKSRTLGRKEIRINDASQLLIASEKMLKDGQTMLAELGIESATSPTKNNNPAVNIPPQMRKSYDDLLDLTEKLKEQKRIIQDHLKKSEQISSQANKMQNDLYKSIVIWISENANLDEIKVTIDSSKADAGSILNDIQRANNFIEQIKRFKNISANQKEQHVNSMYKEGILAFARFKKLTWIEECLTLYP
jgi:hypothetical protein